MDMQERAEELRESVKEKHAGESEEQTKDRMRSTLSRRDNAMRAIQDYRERTGEPTEDETDGAFLSETGADIAVSDFKEREDEDV